MDVKAPYRLQSGKKLARIRDNQRYKYFKEPQKMRQVFIFFLLCMSLFPLLNLSKFPNMQWLFLFLLFVVQTCIIQTVKYKHLKVYITFALPTDFITKAKVLVSTITKDHAYHQSHLLDHTECRQCFNLVKILFKLF